MDGSRGARALERATQDPVAAGRVAAEWPNALRRLQQVAGLYVGVVVQREAVACVSPQPRFGRLASC